MGNNWIFLLQIAIRVYLYPSPLIIIYELSIIFIKKIMSANYLLSNIVVFNHFFLLIWLWLVHDN